MNLGLKHPDPVVETTSLASVEPPDITYTTKLPEKVYLEGKVSALQLETIMYAGMQHEKLLSDGSRAGFLTGKILN